MFPFRRIFGRYCRAIVTLLLGFLSEREDIVPHGGLQDMVVRNRGAHLWLALQHVFLELPQENQDVLKMLREMKVGDHIDHTHSISIDRLAEKYYLMIVIDGIDFV